MQPVKELQGVYKIRPFSGTKGHFFGDALYLNTNTLVVCPLYKIRQRFGKTTGSLVNCNPGVAGVVLQTPL